MNGKRAMSRWNMTRWLMLCALAVVGLFASPSAFAADKVVLKDGTVLTGTIVRETSGIVWIKTTTGGIETERMVLPDELKSVERDAGAAKADAPAEEKADDAAGDQPANGIKLEGDEPEYKPGVPRALVLTLGDEQNGHMVGVFMTAEIIKGLKYFIGLLATLFISFAVAFMVLFRCDKARVTSRGSTAPTAMPSD